jgi:hypothetical protein
MNVTWPPGLIVNVFGLTPALVIVNVSGPAGARGGADSPSEPLHAAARIADPKRKTDALELNKADAVDTEVASENGRGIAAEPVVDDSRVDGAEVGLVADIRAAVLKRWIAWIRIE